LSYLDFGSSNSAVLDTSAELIYALNAGGRQVAADLPFTVADTITIAPDVFVYALNTNFMHGGHPQRPYDIFQITKKGDGINGIPIRTATDFGVVINAPGQVFGARVEGQTLLIYPAAPAGSKLYVYGPGDWVPATVPTSLLTGMPNDRRWGVVYWAAAIILENRVDPRAQDYRDKYAAFVTARRGSVGAQQ
jgi:hypothetical protein